MSDTAMTWATAVYTDEDGGEFTDLALIVVIGANGSRTPRPVAWDLAESRPKRCDSYPNFVGIRA